MKTLLNLDKHAKIDVELISLILSPRRPWWIGGSGEVIHDTVCSPGGQHKVTLHSGIQCEAGHDIRSVSHDARGGPVADQ
eukprot:3102592-Amphidinium_carterae.1